jgi:hypothetical protein
MKTFLHYTKEKELNENQQLDEFLGGVLGKAGSVVKTVGAKVANIRDNPAMALLKTGTRGKEALGGLVDAAKASTEKETSFQGDQADCVRTLTALKAKVDAATSPSSRASRQADLDKAVKRCESVLTSANVDQLSRTQARQNAAALRDWKAAGGMGQYGVP